MPSSRATQRLRNGGSRRSPRLTSAADPNAKPTKSTTRLGRRTSRRRDDRATCDVNAEHVSHDSEDDLSCYGPSEPRRRKRRRSLDQLGDDDDDDESWDRDDGRHEINATRKVESKDMHTPLQQLPDKTVLELVIDILQRRDTYEAFGEPVDPEEIGDYYAVVKEPMDFGTMRAKLHEGMYSSLEAFEHDAFLIPQNAMLFNSPRSVYFKQAQAIEELAKKAFHLLRTEPEKLRTDFSETRRRSRRLPPESINSKSKRGSSTNVKPQNMTRSFSSDCLHKQSMSTSLYADKASTQSHSLIDGTCSSQDARSTYQPWICASRESDSTFPMVYRSSNHLEEARVGETGMHYRDSLMRFTQGLGPIAQKIAARKLQQQVKIPTCFQVQLQPATFQYPAISPTQEPSIYPSILITSSMPNNFPMPSEEPFTLVKNAGVRCHQNQVHIGEKLNATTGISIASKGNITDMEVKGNSQIIRAEKVSAQESRRGGICLALKSEKYCRSHARPSWRM